MTKKQLADLAAGAMNLLNDIRAYCTEDTYEWTPKQINALNELIHMMPEDARDGFFNNATLRARELGVK